VAKKYQEPCVRRFDGESGQASILLVLILGIFLIASLGFAVDFSNMWLQRQAAQSAADAACVAGSMDMLYLQNATITTSPGFSVGVASDCSSSSSAAICKYAAFNGFTATTSASGWGTSTPVSAVAVNWTFPASVAGATASGGITYPFLKVVVQQKVATWFVSLLGIKFMTVGASCTCGLGSGAGVAPLVILDPTDSASLSLTGGVHIVIAGGPAVSIQVNSSSPTAVTCNGGNGYSLDTSTAGPSGNGGRLSIVGGPTLNPYCGALTTLNDPQNLLWISSAGSIANPYARVPTPSQPIAPQFLTSTPIGDATGCIQNAVSSGSNGCARKDATYGLIQGIWVGPGTDSCPATSTSTSQQHYMGMDPGPPYNGFYGSCLEFSPGYYPNGINVTNLAGYANDVAIFRPGIYYLNGNLNVSGSSMIRNAWIGTQPSTQGVIFYFLTGGPTFSGGSGMSAKTLVSAVPSYYLNCSGTNAPNGLPASLSGNVLVSQCSGGGTYVGAPSSDSYSATGLRGLLFFIDPSDTYSNTLMDAGSYLNFSGALYFHNTSYTDRVTLSGAGGSTTYAIGNIVVDQLTLNAAGTIHMGLIGQSSPGPPTVGIVQ
jgi:Flp pilus assembly protein TadG